MPKTISRTYSVPSSAKSDPCSYENDQIYCVVMHIVEGINFNSNDMRDKDSNKSARGRTRKQIIVDATLNSINFQIIGNSTATADSIIFNSNCIWECEVPVIKRIKTENRPVKLTFHLSNPETNESKVIGTLLLPVRGLPYLNAGSNNSEKQLKMFWHKLICVNDEFRSYKPEVLVMLSVIKKSVLHTKEFEHLMQFKNQRKVKPPSSCAPGQSITATMLQSQANIYVQSLSELGLLQVGNDPSIDCDIVEVILQMRQIRNVNKLVKALHKKKKDVKFLLAFDFVGNVTNVEFKLKVEDAYDLNDVLGLRFKSSFKSIHRFFQRIFYLPVNMYTDNAACASYRINFDSLMPPDNYFDDQRMFRRNGTVILDRTGRGTRNICPILEFVFTVELKAIYSRPLNDREAALQLEEDELMATYIRETKTILDSQSRPDIKESVAKLRSLSPRIQAGDFSGNGCDKHKLEIKRMVDAQSRSELKTDAQTPASFSPRTETADFSVDVSTAVFESSTSANSTVTCDDNSDFSAQESQRRRIMDWIKNTKVRSMAPRFDSDGESDGCLRQKFSTTVVRSPIPVSNAANDEEFGFSEDKKTSNKCKKKKSVCCIVRALISDKDENSKLVIEKNGKEINKTLAQRSKLKINNCSNINESLDQQEIPKEKSHYKINSLPMPESSKISEHSEQTNLLQTSDGEAIEVDETLDNDSIHDFRKQLVHQIKHTEEKQPLKISQCKPEGSDISKVQLRDMQFSKKPLKQKQGKVGTRSSVTQQRTENEKEAIVLEEQLQKLDCNMHLQTDTNAIQNSKKKDFILSDQISDDNLVEQKIPKNSRKHKKISRQKKENNIIFVENSKQKLIEDQNPSRVISDLTEKDDIYMSKNRLSSKMLQENYQYQNDSETNGDSYEILEQNFHKSDNNVRCVWKEIDQYSNKSMSVNLENNSESDEFSLFNSKRNGVSCNLRSNNSKSLNVSFENVIPFNDSTPKKLPKPLTSLSAHWIKVGKKQVESLNEVEKYIEETCKSELELQGQATDEYIENTGRFNDSVTTNESSKVELKLEISSTSSSEDFSYMQAHLLERKCDVKQRSVHTLTSVPITKAQLITDSALTLNYSSKKNKTDNLQNFGEDDLNYAQTNRLSDQSDLVQSRPPSPDSQKIKSDYEKSQMRKSKNRLIVNQLEESFEVIEDSNNDHVEIKKRHRKSGDIFKRKSTKNSELRDNDANCKEPEGRLISSGEEHLLWLTESHCGLSKDKHIDVENQKSVLDVQFDGNIADYSGTRESPSGLSVPGSERSSFNIYKGVNRAHKQSQRRLQETGHSPPESNYTHLNYTQLQTSKNKLFTNELELPSKVNQAQIKKGYSVKRKCSRNPTILEDALDYEDAEEVLKLNKQICAVEPGRSVKAESIRYSGVKPNFESQFKAKENPDYELQTQNNKSGCEESSLKQNIQIFEDFIIGMDREKQKRKTKSTPVNPKSQRHIIDRPQNDNSPAFSNSTLEKEKFNFGGYQRSRCSNSRTSILSSSQLTKSVQAQDNEDAETSSFILAAKAYYKSKAAKNRHRLQHIQKEYRVCKTPSSILSNSDEDPMETTVHECSEDNYSEIESRSMVVAYDELNTLKERHNSKCKQKNPLARDSVRPLPTLIGSKKKVDQSSGLEAGINQSIKKKNASYKSTNNFESSVDNSSKDKSHSKRKKCINSQQTPSLNKAKVSPMEVTVYLYDQTSKQILATATEKNTEAPKNEICCDSVIMDQTVESSHDDLLNPGHHRRLNLKEDALEQQRLDSASLNVNIRQMAELEKTILNVHKSIQSSPHDKAPVMDDEYERKFCRLEDHIGKLKAEMEHQLQLIQTSNQAMQQENTELIKDKQVLKERIVHIEQQISELAVRNDLKQVLNNMHSQMSKSKEYYKKQWQCATRQVQELKMAINERNSHLDIKNKKASCIDLKNILIKDADEFEREFGQFRTSVPLNFQMSKSTTLTPSSRTNPKTDNRNN